MPRRWTILVVPHQGEKAHRSFEITERGGKLVRYGGMAVAALAVLSMGIGARDMARWLRGQDDAAVRVAYSALLARFDSLSDTLDAIGKRDVEIRLLAGLSVDDTYVAGRDGGHAPFGIALSTDTPDVDGMIVRAKMLSASFAEVSDSLRLHAERYAAIPSIMPTAGWLSSAFSRSRFHPILHINRPHEGIDVSAPMGAPIVAPAGGVVVLVTKETGYGNVLEIDHGNGIVTKYAHCSRIVVHMGERVKRGQVIANVGNTGLSTGPHLHYEIHVNGKVVDPLTYVLPAGVDPD